MNHGVTVCPCQTERNFAILGPFPTTRFTVAKKITLFHLKLYLVLKETAQLLAV